MALKYALQLWMCSKIIVLLCKLIYNLLYYHEMYLEVDLKADIKMKYVHWSTSRTSNWNLDYFRAIGDIIFLMFQYQCH